MRYLLTLLLLLLLLPLPSMGQSWDWSPGGQTHHEAVVKVSYGGNAGSGVYVDLEGYQCVLTCAHLYEGQSGAAVVTFADGTTRNGEFTRDKYGYDIAAILTSFPEKQPVILATSNPQQGETVEYVTYGGPKGELRHWYSNYTGTTFDGLASTDAFVTSGDSGGPIFNRSGQLVGIQSVGLSEYTTIADWPVYKGSGFATYTHVADFTNRVRVSRGVGVFGPNGGMVGVGSTQYCDPRSGNCSPSFYPPKGQQQQSTQIDYNKLAQVITSQYADRIRGPQGPQGPPGNDAKELTINVSEVAAALVENHREELRGEPGEIDIPSITASVIDNLPPVKMEIAKGKEVQRTEKKLGETIRLNFTPIQRGKK